MRPLPTRIFSGEWDGGHVQGIAVDFDKGYIYYSFTTVLVKSDPEGHILGSVGGLTGHLGCIDFNPADGCVYGSLEFKRDAIGVGIARHLGLSPDDLPPDAFFCAVFDVDRIDRPGMDAWADGVMLAAHLPEVTADYVGCEPDGRPHIRGCSGIDGTGFGPGFADRVPGRLHIAYGIYGETDRVDNDCQVILEFDPADIRREARPLSVRTLADQPDGFRSAGARCLGRYFLYTGNTEYGIQNLKYDAYLDRWLVCVYRGRKPQFDNADLYMIDASVPPVWGQVPGRGEEGHLLTLAKPAPSGASLDAPAGWHWYGGQEGVVPVGDGRYYFSVSRRPKGYTSTVELRRWEPDDPRMPFVLCE